MTRTLVGSLMNARGDSQKLFQNLSVYSTMVVDTSYPFRNVPLEIYVQQRINASSDVLGCGLKKTQQLMVKRP